MTEQRQLEGEAPDQVTDEIEEEVDQLEEDVSLMAQKIAEFRETLPEQLQNTLASILSAQRPVILNHDSDNDPGPSSNANQETVELVQDDVAHTEKIQTIKEKISSNNFAMSLVLKRMKDCMSRIEKLESFNKGTIIHPAFKRRRMQDCFM